MTPKTLKIIPCALALALLVGCNSSNNPLAEDTIDTVPPAVPVNVELQAHPGQDPSLHVLWDSNAESDLAGYVVQRSEDGGDSWTDASSVITTTEFVDTYYTRAWYRVAAVDISENQSAYSAPVAYVATNGTPKFPANAEGQRL